MKKYGLILFVLAVFILIYTAEIFPAEFNWQNIGRENLEVKTILVDSGETDTIYLGSDSGVFKSDDAGASWRNILSIRAGKGYVNFLFSGPQERRCLYAATGNGLFISRNRGKTWQRLFKGRNSSENYCTAILVSSGCAYLGTREGLFISQDNGRTWHRVAGVLGKSSIANIACYPQEPDSIYVASIAGVFKKEKEADWEMIFSGKRATGKEDSQVDEEQADEIEGGVLEIRFIAIDPRESRNLYLATSRGVFQSCDKGKNWEAVPDYGLLSRDVRFLLFSTSSEIYAATESAIFQYASGRWRELSFGLAADRVNFLALDRQGNLYAACDTGLFRAGADILDDSRQGGTLDLYLEKEPAINKVQQAAVKYAEVEPEKIMRWRKQAAKKAFLPEVSVGVDRDAGDIWHWESGSTTKSEDDILRKGKSSLEWSVTCSWDLGELIWNGDQTSIDTRSKLMVELREDILDEVTKLYFERIRTKMELDNLSIEERKKRFEKELKIRELTASLDALTGGYFSQQLKDKS